MNMTVYLKKLFSLTCFVMTLFFLSGCVNDSAEFENEDIEALRCKVELDPAIIEYLSIDRINTMDLEDGLLMVQVTVQNVKKGFLNIFPASREPLGFACAFVWFDKAGNEAGTENESLTWINKEIYPGDIMRITAIAPNTECKDFILKIKRR